jgi:hypothetical protein
VKGWCNDLKLTSEVVEDLAAFSLFQSVIEFEQHMEGWLQQCQYDLSRGEMMALKMLMQFSKRVPGVCHEEIGRVLETIWAEYDCFGISRATFKRMRRKAKALGVLSVYETERKDGARDCNLYVFHHYPNYLRQ